MSDKSHLIFTCLDKQITCLKFWVCFVLVDARCDNCGYWHWRYDLTQQTTKHVVLLVRLRSLVVLDRWTTVNVEACTSKWIQRQRCTFHLVCTKVMYLLHTDIIYRCKIIIVNDLFVQVLNRKWQLPTGNCIGLNIHYILNAQNVAYGEGLAQTKILPDLCYHCACVYTWECWSIVCETKHSFLVTAAHRNILRTIWDYLSRNKTCLLKEKCSLNHQFHQKHNNKFCKNRKTLIPDFKWGEGG